jgi:hypothetical protein
MKLNNIQRYAIQGMFQNSKTATQIAKELEIPEKDVQTYLNKLQESLNKIAKNKKSDGLFGKTTQGGNKLGGAIMTKGASERGDKFVKNEDGELIPVTKTEKPKDWDSKIHKIREE